MAKLLQFIFLRLLIIVLVINSAISKIVSTPKYIYNTNGLGAYSFEFKTDDGTYRREEGGSNPNDGSLVVRGEFGYVDSKGHLYTVRYIADSNGYRPLLEEESRFNDRNIV